MSIDIFPNPLNAKIDTANTNINTANTTLGTVNTNVNTANTNINTTNTRVGTNADAAGTATLFALLKKLDAKSAGTDLFALTPNIQSYMNATDLTITAFSSADLITVNGKGILTSAEFISGNFNEWHWAMVVVLDGVEYQTVNYYTPNTGTGTAIGVISAGRMTPGTTTDYTVYSIQRLSGNMLRFNTSCIIRLKNLKNSSQTLSATNAGARLVASMT